jgi:hypothetical protein
VTRSGGDDHPAGHDIASEGPLGAVDRDKIIRQAAGIGVRANDVQVSAVGWVPIPDMEERRWLEYGKRIGRAGNGTSWWIGDWLRYGSRRFGEKYALAARVTGYDVQTLMNYAYVSEHVPISDRRADVSWSHHAELAKLDPHVRAEWLERTTRDRLSVKDLRFMLRKRAATTDPWVPRAAEAANGPLVCPTCGQPLPPAHDGDGRVSEATSDLRSGPDV